MEIEKRRENEELGGRRRERGEEDRKEYQGPCGDVNIALGVLVEEGRSEADLEPLLTILAAEKGGMTICN